MVLATGASTVAERVVVHDASEWTSTRQLTVGQGEDDVTGEQLLPRFLLSATVARPAKLLRNSSWADINRLPDLPLPLPSMERVFIAFGGSPR